MRRVSLVLILLSSLVHSQVGRIPSFSVQLSEGKKVSVKELLREGPLLIDFWALWCTPCLKAMRHLDGFHSKYGERGFRVLAINLDTERSGSKVRSYIRSRGYHLLVGLDPSQESYRRLNGNTLPYTILVDRSGRIVYRHTGYVPGDERVLEGKILSLLGGASENPASFSSE